MTTQLLTTANLAVTTAVFYGLLLVVVYLRRPVNSQLSAWMIIYLAASCLWLFTLETFLWPGRLLGFPSLALLVLNVAILGLATGAYLERPLRGWLLAVPIAAVLFLSWWQQPLTRSATAPAWDWLQVPLAVAHLGAVAGWLVLVFLAYGWTMLSYRRTPFPWHANRYLFWSLCILLAAAGEALSLMAFPVLQTLGFGLRFLAAVGFAYATTSLIRFDVRTRFRRGLLLLILFTATTLPAAALFYLYDLIAGRLPPAAAALIAISLTALGFMLYVPLYNLLERLIYRYLLGKAFVTGVVLRDYAQVAASTLDLEQLSVNIFDKLDELFGLNRGALVLVTPSATMTGMIDVEPIPAAGFVERNIHTLPADSALLQTLKSIAQPLLQYEIEFNPNYHLLKTEIDSWLGPLGMELYAPIRSSGTLDGFIALGPKRSGYTYRANELDLIQLLADQTAVALENARLYRELASQNDRVRDLNLDLIRQNERLETLDMIKSDFITIASHELRTPLTQIKGYTDILTSLNEENALTREQTRQIISQIERASGSLEQLITAMLDASQIDVDEMRLTFTDTRLDTILRLAQEPLSETLRTRQLQLTIHRAAEMPPLQADFKRLVQAFTNIFSNAVKYTPDQGSITVTCQLLSEEAPQEDSSAAQQAIEVQITDTGIGINPAHQNLIFEKFFRLGNPQLHSSGTTKFLGAGPGLGLTIARGVIEAHGGRIWVESEGEDRERLPGSTFTIMLPLTPPAPAEGGPGEAS